MVGAGGSCEVCRSEDVTRGMVAPVTCERLTLRSSSAGEPGAGRGLRVMNSRNSLAKASVLRARSANGSDDMTGRLDGQALLEHPELSRSAGQSQLLSVDDAIAMVGRRDASFARGTPPQIAVVRRPHVPP